MLHPIAPQLTLHKDAYFLDSLNQQLYFLKQGNLYTHNLNTKIQQHISISLPTNQPQIINLPQLITLEGETITNADRNIIAANSDQVALRGSTQIGDGSFWEWHIPLTLEGIQLGVCEIRENEIIKNQLITFNSSTARTVTFSLRGNQLAFWVNGTKPAKGSSKTLTFELGAHKVYPYARLKGKGSVLAYIPFTSMPQLLTISRFNPFGKLWLDEPAQSAKIDFKSSKTAIKQLIQLSGDRLLLVWQNNRARIYYRNSLTKQFVFDPLEIQGEYIQHLFTQAEYQQLKNCSQLKNIFKYSTTFDIKNAFEWIRYLISILDVAKSQRHDIYQLLLSKLIAIRPYLSTASIKVPNFIIQAKEDTQKYRSSLKYFDFSNKQSKSTLVTSFRDFIIEGSVEDITSNYLVSKKENTVIIYYLGDSVKEVFRENVNQNRSLSKRTITDTYEEEDIRYLKSDGSFLYKILVGCLSKEKKIDELHPANQHDIEELKRDFGVDEAAARAALEITGNIQEAVVLIFTQKDQAFLKKQDNIKLEDSANRSSISLIQAPTIFTRLILLVDNTLFLLGILPKSIKKWVYRGQNQYVDLVYFKHQNSLQEIAYQNWYKTSNHTALHILENHQLKQTPRLLFKQSGRYFCLQSKQKTLQKKEIKINLQHLYESNNSISFGDSQPLQSFIHLEKVVRSIYGELVCTSPQIKQSPNTTALLNQKLLTNCEHTQNKALRVKIKTEESLIVPIEQNQQIILLTVQSGPPGINKNYSISNILLPNSFFLANYPHGYKLRQLHNKVINVSTLKIRRSVNRKNINYIVDGTIQFRDIWGNKSQLHPFSFHQNQQEVTLNFKENSYWKEIIVSPNYTQHKKLPFEIGSITATGTNLSHQSFYQQTYQVLSKLFSSLNQRVKILHFQFIESTIISLDLNAPSLENLLNALNNNQKFKVVSKKTVAIDESQSYNSYFQSNSPNLSDLDENQVRKYVDLNLNNSNLTDQQQQISIFNKIWQNKYGQQYLLSISDSPTDIPIVPLPYLKLLISKLDSQKLQKIVNTTISAISSTRSKLYQTLKNSELSYLYFQTDLYSEYYYNLIDSSKLQKRHPLYPQPVIKSDIIVFKSENARRIIVKLPSQYRITNFTLKFQRCQTSAKINYKVFKLLPQVKEEVCSGRILEQQWIQITKFSQKTQVQQLYGASSKLLNIIGLDACATNAQYIQIQLDFTETGILSHENQTGKIPQIDILPQLYGYELGPSSPLSAIEQIFTMQPEDMFFLSVSPLGKYPMQKYSVSKGKNTQFLYFTAQKQDLSNVHRLLQEKIAKSDFESIVSIQSKLINSGSFSRKVTLDYLYTLFCLCSNQLLKNGEKVNDTLCDEIFTKIVQVAQGPIKIIGFKVISHKIPLLLKSLQFIQAELPSLGTISFSYEQLLEVLDFNNTDLCKSLSRLILRGVAYNQQWVELLIKMSHLTDCHSDIVAYFINKQDWLQNQFILQYLFTLPEQQFLSTFLDSISYGKLSKLVLTPNAKPRLEMFLTVIVERASVENPVDLDVVSLIFQQEEVKWQQLQRVMSCCPQATDIIIHQFLQSQNSETLAKQHGLLLSTAALPKYSQEFALFLDKIYHKNKTALAETFLSLNGKCTSLHYDFLDTLSSFIVDQCSVGGVEGVRLISEERLTNLLAAVQMLKVTQKLPQGADLPNEDQIISWYLRNNNYEFTSTNPASRPPAYHLIRQLFQLVLQLLRTATPAKVLAQYTVALQNIKQSRKLSLTQRHLLFNQIHHGVTELLSTTLTPGALAKVFVGSQNPLLSTVINQLKANSLKNSSRNGKWAPGKEVDITQKFTVPDFPDVRDIQLGKGGNKSPTIKIPLAQKTLKLQSQDLQQPSKFIIGFILNDHADNKTAILPSRVELHSGNHQSRVKIGDMFPIEDQYYLQFGVKLFGLNLNSTFSLGTHSFKNLEFRLSEPTLSSANDLLETGQRSKKGATFNLSFISIYGYDSQPAEEPDYSHLYITLLGFLGQKKYQQDLKAVVSSPQFDQKLQLVIQVLNDLLPNNQIEQLLLALNIAGEGILEHVLRSKGANPRLVNLLVMGRLTKDNISKLIAYTLQNISQEFVNIVTLSLRLASYSKGQSVIQPYSNFENVKLLLQKYQQSKGQNQKIYRELLTSITTVPNIYRYEINKLKQLIWSKSNRSLSYSILAAILPYYPSELESFASNGYTIQLYEEILTIMQTNKNSTNILNDPSNHLALLCTLILNNNSRQLLLQRNAPLTLVQLLKSNKSLLVKYEGLTMKLLINFFQSTCIGTKCQDQFGQVLISLMTSLNDFDTTHHQFFIHSFFFPLINAFKGVPVIFVWKHQAEYLKQPTDILKKRPIRSSLKVLQHEQDFYHPIENIDPNNLQQSLLFVTKQKNVVSYKLSGGVLQDILSKKDRKHSILQGNVVVQISSEKSITLSTEQFLIYQQNTWEKHLLTNATLTSLDNPWILQQNYRTTLSLRQSTPERVYFVPQEIQIGQLLKQFNIGGLKIHPTDLSAITPINHYNGQAISQNSQIKNILSSQKEAYLKIQIQTSSLFNNTTIEGLAQGETSYQSFVAQETIFKAFEQKKGLQKMITVLKGCVKNWSSGQQCNIWGQYLKQLESYSCFPVFSSLYMTKQQNVGLLFDLLLGQPDKQDNKKWLQKEKQSVKQLYMIIKDVFAVKGEQALVVRQYALKSGFYSTMLERLYLITKENKRFKNQNQKEEQKQELVIPTLQQKNSEQDFKIKLQKKKGVGYGTDSSTNHKWDLTGHQQARKQKSQQILGLLKILEQFFDHKQFAFPPELLDKTYQSSLLPILESSLRGGSLLQISKFADLFQGQLSFIQVIARSGSLLPTLMPIPKCYEPKQSESIYSLLKTLNNTSKIFISCLTGSASQKVSQQIAKKIIATFEIVEQAISQYSTSHNDQEQQKKILELPLAKKYPLLLKDLRFDYTDMKDNGKITKHHYSSSYQAGHKPPVEKTIRLAQQLADISHALPIEHTNAIFVRCDRERVDFMQALIMGSNGTPYGHGAYLFDIHFEDNYPNGPPKVNLTTTGNGQIRFNPNLYACGKVCLSLLGTWRGNATENWDAKVSTLLQVLVSIQSIIMSEDIYFNEPGFEHQQGTAEGQKKNEAYANIVRYGNIKYAMIENIKNPPKGFESIIKRHFYLKKDEILQECQKWLKLAQKRQASYNGLVSDHNYSWCTTFKKSKTQYKTMLQKAIKELQVQINKLQPPTQQDFKKQSSPNKKKKKQLKIVKEVSIDPQLQEIDVSYGGAQTQFQELDINDQKVKDRWSRYIGAMGVQAVSKQSKASILILGLGGVGVEIAKNIILSGCRQLALWDDKIVDWQDLSSQFFLGDADVGQSRLDSTYYKLQQLNHYVKLTKLPYNSEDFSNISKFQVVIATQRNHQELLKLDSFCRKNNIHFISVDCFGPYGQIFNDFGDSFEILDKNGEETIEILLEEITIAEKGLVKLLKGQRHPFEDGESVRIQGVKGMKSLTTESLSINGTIHKIQVVDQNSFYIGDTTVYSNYEGEGSARNVKTANLTGFKSLEACSQLQNIDSNLEYYDWAKSGKLKLLHLIFIALSSFKLKHSRLPKAWDREDSQKLVQIVKQKKADITAEDQAYIKLFSYTCSGNFGPICAFFGGVASQEAFKAITGKYTPINQYFIAQFSEIVQTLPQNQQAWEVFLKSHEPVLNRTQGLRRVVGDQLLKKIQNCRVFMVGSGAIGCQLLKNFAMLELGAGQSGSIVVTDPDHIETSNLNRQFLFRQKHLRKPKSATASAAAIQMNPRLKGHIKPRLEKVCEATKDVFSNEFFESQTIIANALDNVEARRYIDSRCVDNKIPLLESGTLSSKGHVQVIIPYKTETYGSKQDPNDAQGEIPHCTLKMFPQETLHCVEWARDLFGKQFTLGPKALQKLLQQQQKYVPVPSDIQMLQDCIKLIKRRPSSFEDAVEVTANLFYQVFRNDIMQLLYTYPLDAKTKDGKPFWKLPKRPPVPIQEIIPADPLHATFIASYSVLLAKIYNIPYPKDFRDPKRREQIALTASRIKVEPFVPSDKLAKQMTEEVNKDANPTQNENVQDKQHNEGDETSLFNKYKTIYNQIKENGQIVESKPEQFQKDEDQNGHIDLIYSMANLRSRNYKLEEMDWINVKIKAGRITPALSTTTSCIAALQTIQLVKYLRGCPLETMRNAFINLAVPYMQMGEPGAVEKIKVHENLETTLWQRWSIGPISKLQTLGEFMKAVEQKFGVVVKGLSLTEGEQIYSDFVFSLQSKKAEKEILMSKQLQAILSEQGQQSVKFADFTLVMGVGQTLIKHAPTLRLLLEP